jgi:biopolymer transport protein ExbB
MNTMKRLITAGILAGLLMLGQTALAQDSQAADSAVETQIVSADTMVGDLTVEELIGAEDMAALDSLASEGGMGLHEQLKTKFVEGDPRFMSLVALVLVLGLALCIERIIYLTLAEINTKKLLTDIEKKVEAGDVEGAKDICRDTRGPVASVCYQGLMHIDEPVEDIERSIISYGSVQTARLERGTSWIKLCIAIAPSLGFLGTVIGMVMAFDQIQTEGDIGPTIVAQGMKVALLTTIFGIVVALILQVFYNFVNSRIDRLTIQMEEGAITLLDIIAKGKRTKG